MTWPAAQIRVAAGVLSLSPLPGAEGAQALARAGVDLVLSLTEASEDPGLAATLQAAGLVQLTLPIPDYGVPDAAAAPVLAQALAVLQAGGHFALHCRGGCGRSGMIALRLMRMAGEPGDAALQRLRAVRPCAIETPEQLAWALRD